MTVHRRPLGIGPHPDTDPDEGRAQRAMTPAERAAAEAARGPAGEHVSTEPVASRRTLGEGSLPDEDLDERADEHPPR
ncbi:hypothetical protein QMK19_19510 [Streptomyces sp. H10-C2]|uniref:hypothetical protein n=1 Tax=unclassified Streptomyces TaxID=2593676 RepID=UPI0024BA5955|nr:MULTISPECIES: hypothetical protein [unclassified Streptomyces]MDJ0343384.1 hypothetical protein [Streptomyces sp. PH10-H1]MDJ0371805.1 hypothetical protein [Streptomyces sp. H10-C2]